MRYSSAMSQKNNTKNQNKNIPDKSGFVYINKPTGFTSHDVVNVLRKKFNLKKIGHAGTLDPLATGVLILGINKATKLLDKWHEFSKTYITDLEFGKISNTYDIEGVIKEVAVTKNKIPNTNLLEMHLKKFLGTQEQIPPAFSAKKINGRTAYTLARAGKDVELKPKKITIHSIKLLNFNYPQAQLEIICSTGTYIRSIINDLGQVLNCGAIMTDLIRTNIGFVNLEMCDEIHKDSDKLPIIHAMSDLER